VKKHGGEMTATSEPGGGARFEIFLPLEHEPLREASPTDGSDEPITE
jgi:K+-sensing histidine kinase KdpD